MNDLPEIPREVGPRGRLGPAAAVQILCVEDNSGDFGLICEHLRRAPFPTGIELQRARSVAEACELIETAAASTPFEIVLLDLSLPDSCGAETFYRICAVAPQTAVVILSGDNDQQLALQLVESGAQDYLPKDTLTPDLLMRCVTYALKRQGHRVEMENLTERLRRTTEELKSAQQYLIHAEKLESLGRLASSVAHEVKNPLGVVQMGLDYLVETLAHLDGDVGRTLTLMNEAVTRADCVIRDMLNYSRSETPRMESGRLNDLVACVERMLKHECARRNVRLRVELATPSPMVRCDPNAIEQLLINVVTNALQATGKGGTITMRTACEPGPGEGGAESDSAPDGAAVIEVRDQGPGIPEHIMNRIFEPFFTTKPNGEGTGLGLAICKRVIEHHRGQLLLSNVEAPRGLRVRIVLKAEPAEPPARANETPGEIPSVLLPSEAVG